MTNPLEDDPKWTVMGHSFRLPDDPLEDDGEWTLMGDVGALREIPVSDVLRAMFPQDDSLKVTYYRGDGFVRAQYEQRDNSEHARVHGPRGDGPVSGEAGVSGDCGRCGGEVPDDRARACDCGVEVGGDDGGGQAHG